MRAHRAALCLAVSLTAASWQPGPAAGPPDTSPAPGAAAQDQDLTRLRDQRRRFQDQELITARPFGYIFNPGDPPRLIWRDVDEVRRLGSDGRLRVRWFDTDLKEADKPAHPGRWAAYVEGTAPNGTPVRRSLTLYCRPPMFFLFFLPPDDIPAALPQKTSTIATEVWDEHRDELARLPRDLLFRAVNDNPEAVALLAGLAGMKPLGRPARATETAAVLDRDFHLAVKLKLQGLASRARTLQPPRMRATPAPSLHDGTPAEAGMRPETAERLRAICRAWADDSKEPFVTLVARHGVVVLHEAYGRDGGKPLGLDSRHDVASISKTATALLFSRFLDQGLLRLDDPVSAVFPGYPDDPAHVPTFRHCLTHMSGLSGHGDWGGARNPHFENVVLNGVDANAPGKTYDYSGNGFELAAKAMEVVAGRSAPHLYRQHLFGPLAMGDVSADLASSGMRFTARELAAMAQLMTNRGSYGDKEFFTRKTFEALLPEPLSRRYPGVAEEEGVGMHWMRYVKPGSPPGSTRPEDLLFDPPLLGHGSLTSCIFLADPARGLVITQVRKTAGPRFGDWSLKFFRTIADGLVVEGDGR
jgi:CubicO group peptidase (beta-lactamase class C family)